MPIFAHAYSSPGDPTGYVNDFAGVLSSETRVLLEQNLVALEKETGDEVAVVTVKSLGGDTVENYAEKLFKQWEIGKKDADNGLLVLVAMDEHKIRIEVGYGLEGTVTDLQSGIIIREVITPAFKAGDYDGGVARAVDAIIKIITGAPGAERFSTPAEVENITSGLYWKEILFGILFFGNILIGLLGRTKSWWLGGVLGAIAGLVISFIWGFIYIGIVSMIGLSLLGLLLDFVASKGGGRGPSIIGGIFGGGGGRGGGGGGFGGFGGGGSGGGGSSGSW